MMLKEGQVFVKANAIKTRGGLKNTEEKPRQKLKQKAKQRKKSQSIPAAGRLGAAQNRKDVAK